MKDKLRHVKLSSIIVGERFREDFGDLAGLKESIAEKGVLQPITIDAKGNLLAGGRRVQACTELELLEIPALVREVTDEIDAREIELIENVHRKDFNWQERVRLTARIHALYMEKDPKWSMRKTAQLIEQSPITVSRANALATELETDEKIQECPTAEDALRYIRLKEEKAIVEELAKRAVQAASSPAGTVAAPQGSKEVEIRAMTKRASQDYIVKDVFEGLKSLKDGSFRFMDCDPPYGIEFTKNADRYAVGSKTNEQISKFIDIDPSEYPEFLEKFFKETYRVAATDCWMVFWFNMKWYGTIIQHMIRAGWKPDIVPAIWEKNNHSENGSKDILARLYEPFIVAKKGFPILAKSGHSNVFKGGLDKHKYHPTQKPVKLMQDILATFALSGDRVLVPFAGSGSTMRAAYLNGNFCTGFDLSDEYKNHFILGAIEDFTGKDIDSEEDEDLETEE